VRRACLVLPALLLSASCSRDKAGTPKDSTAVTVSGTRIAAPRTGPIGEWNSPTGDNSASRYSDAEL